jgi:beta-lactamase regulating signal transducer with metallopeptidase domain
MEDIFRQILEMSLYGSIAIVCVLILRLLFRNVPKKVTILLWIIVAVRLLCPVNIGSRFGVMNLFANSEDTAIVSQETEDAASAEEVIPAEDPGNEEKVSEAGSGLPDNAPYEVMPSAVRGGIKIPGPYTILLFVWITGMVIFCTSLIVSAAKLKIRLRYASPNEDGTYGTDGIRSAFVSGILDPRIYIPAVTAEVDRGYILLHEKTHIRYHDQITKMICLAALGIHWFNPLVWAAYILFSRDLEMRVDETVIELLGEDHRKEYCKALVSNSQMPLMYKVTGTAFAGRSFGGTEVKMRIKNLVIHKKTSLMTTAGIIAALLGITMISSACAPQDEPETVPSEDTAATAALEETEALVEDSIAALQVLRSEELDPDSENVSDYGTLVSITLDELTEGSCISAEDVEDEDLRDIAIEMEENGLQIYDLDTINQGLGGITFNEGIAVFTDNYVQVFFNADMDDITTICSNLGDDAHLVLTSTADNYYTAAEVAGELQGLGLGTEDTPVNVSVKRNDVETDDGTVYVYFCTIEIGSDSDTGDTYVISYDPESGTASFQAVTGQ